VQHKSLGTTGQARVEPSSGREGSKGTQSKTGARAHRASGGKGHEHKGQWEEQQQQQQQQQQQKGGEAGARWGWRGEANLQCFCMQAR